MISFEHQKIIALLHPLYEEIRALELELALTFGGGDMRPRIERFHDCVRSHSSGHAVGVEELSYALSAIRYLQAKPLAELKPQPHSPSTSLLKKSSHSLVAQRAATRDDKQSLSDYYLRYGLLFAALFKTQADRDMKERVEEKDEHVEQLADVEASLKSLAQGKGSNTALSHAATGLPDKDINAIMHKLAAKNSALTPEMLAKAMQMVKDRIKEEDKDIRELQDAHMLYATAQLSLYEQGKDIVKKMARDGLNIAGQFVGTAVTQDNAKGRGR